MSRVQRVVSEYMAKIGSKGGKTKGAKKRRSLEHYRKAASKRWSKKYG